MKRPRQSLRILITNHGLDAPGGAEAVVRDFALGLLARGHRPICYAPALGEAAQQIRARGVPVIDDLAQLATPPDLIHGHHFIASGEALIRFPGTPAVSFCHGWGGWMERPVLFPEVRRWIAVDEACRSRLVEEEQVAPEKVELLLNAVDLTRIPPRTARLPQAPRRALAFDKAAPIAGVLARACALAGLELEVLDRAGADAALRLAPESRLTEADVVFASSRGALEALCAGAAVILCDSRGLGGMVTHADCAGLRPLNFGFRTLTQPVTVDGVAQALNNYDAEDAARVSAAMRKDADLTLALDRLEAIYGEVLAEAEADPVDEGEHREARHRFLMQALPRRWLDDRWPWMRERRVLEQQIKALEALIATEPRIETPTDSGELADAAEAQRRLSQSLRTARRLDDALVAAHAAERMAPDNARVRIELAVVLLEKGELDAALSNAETACGLIPESGNAAYVLSQVLDRMDRRAEAMEAADRAVAAQPDQAKFSRWAGSLRERVARTS